MLLVAEVAPIGEQHARLSVPALKRLACIFSTTYSVPSAEWNLRRMPIELHHAMVDMHFSIRQVS